MNQIVKLNNMSIILSLILLLTATCYSTPGWAEEYIITEGNNVIYTCESYPDKGIVLSKRGEYNYFVTNISRGSYSFYPNYILGKCDKGLFAFNETTYEVNYFDKQKELDDFKQENELGYSYAEKRLIKMNSLKLSFLAFIIIFLIIAFLKSTKTDILLLKKRFAFLYIALFILTKLFHMFYAHKFLYDPGELFSPDNVSLILLFSVCFVSPWLIMYSDFKKVKTFNRLKWNSILFVLLLILDFWIITISYFWSGLFRYHVIYFILLCNLVVILFNWIVSYISNKIKKSRLGNSIIHESN